MPQVKNVNSGAAYVASLVVSTTSKVRLLGFSGYNSKTSAQYIQVFDATSLPADGQTPVIRFPVNASDKFAIDFGQHGRSFDNGIVICNSSTVLTKTIGSADCTFDVQVMPAIY